MKKYPDSPQKSDFATQQEYMAAYGRWWRHSETGKAAKAKRKLSPKWKAQRKEQKKRYKIKHRLEIYAKRKARQSFKILKTRCDRIRRMRISSTPIEIRFKDSDWPKILDRFHHACAYCGTPESDLPAPLQSDHVLPLCRGGLHTIDNIVCCCPECNTKKHTYTLEEVGWKDPRSTERNTQEP